MAALSWMFRHSKMPWEHLLVASVRVILQHHGITSGRLIVDDTDNPRSKAAKALAYLYKLRDKESGGYLWGQSLVFLVLVTPKISLPVGVVFYQPAPELSAWYKQEKALKKQGVAKNQRPPKPASNPAYPSKGCKSPHKHLGVKQLPEGWSLDELAYPLPQATPLSVRHPLGRFGSRPVDRLAFEPASVGTPRQRNAPNPR